MTETKSVAIAATLFHYVLLSTLSKLDPRARLFHALTNNLRKMVHARSYTTNIVAIGLRDNRGGYLPYGKIPVDRDVWVQGNAELPQFVKFVFH